MTAFVMAHVQIEDPKRFTDYTSVFGPTLVPFGGRVVIVEDEPSVVEGEWPPGRTVLLEFDSRDQAQGWFDSAAYQDISEIRRAASTGTMAIFERISNPN